MQIEIITVLQHFKSAILHKHGSKYLVILLTSLTSSIWYLYSITVVNQVFSLVIMLLWQILDWFYVSYVTFHYKKGMQSLPEVVKKKKKKMIIMVILIS